MRSKVTPDYVTAGFHNAHLEELGLRGTGTVGLEVPSEDLHKMNNQLIKTINQSDNQLTKENATFSSA